jgi:hypothetical protein
VKESLNNFVLFGAYKVEAASSPFCWMRMNEAQTSDFLKY